MARHSDTFEPIIFPMLKKLIFSFFLLSLMSCGEKTITTTPELSPITSSIYSSGIIASQDQYLLFPKTNGEVIEIFVEVGDTVSAGEPILRIENQLQEINNQNAALSSKYYSLQNNEDQLRNLENNVSIARTSLTYDSTQYERQKKLFSQGVGVELELEASELKYKNALVTYNSAQNQLDEFKRQLNFSYNQAKNNLKIAQLTKEEFIITSAINGIVYDLNCVVGDLVGPQRNIGVIGASNEFVLTMLIDESDILQVRKGQEVIVKLDSYPDTVFTAEVSKIYPFMDLQSKSFTVEAKFKTLPPKLYPNMNFEANIVIATKNKALLIPREYLLNDNRVILNSGDTISVETGLMDYRKVEITKGLSENDVLILPAE